MLALIKIAVAGRKWWLLGEKLNLHKSLVRSDMDPDLLLILAYRKQFFRSLLFERQTLTFQPELLPQGGDAGGDRANSVSNSWLAGNNQQALADASAGTCRYRSPA
jgi:hypothetical protein